MNVLNATEFVHFKMMDKSFEAERCLAGLRNEREAHAGGMESAGKVRGDHSAPREPSRPPRNCRDKEGMRFGLF